MELFIFDVDGVLVSLKAIPNHDAVRLSAQVARRHALAYLTGRDATWLERNMVLRALGKQFEKTRPAHHHIATENAGVLMYHDRERWISARNPAFPDLSPLRQQVREQTKGIPGVVFHADKQAIITVGVDHKLGREHPTVIQGMQQAGEIMQSLIRQHADHVEYQRTTNAHDIIPKGLNKTYGADYLMRQLKDPPEHVYMFGDAPADLVMIAAAKQRNLPYTFYYVGDPKELPKEADPNIHVYPNLYDRAVVDILKSLS